MARAGRIAVLSLGLTVLALALSSCTEVEEFESGYEPSSAQPIEGSDIQLVTFTAEAARRAGVRLATVTARAGRREIPYAALIYNDEGDTFAYVSARPLRYVRTPIDVHRITHGRVLLDHGPAAGTRVVTVGAAEVYSAEFGVED
jgi:hypothetical protein